MKTLLVIVMICFSILAKAQNQCGTKEQNDATEKICEKTFEGLAAIGGGLACGPVCAGIAGAGSTPFAERLCHGAREYNEHICSSNQKSNEAQQEKPNEEISSPAFGEKKSGANNCTAQFIVFTSKTRR